MYRRLIGVLIAAVALTAVVFPPGTPQAQTKTLRMANWVPTVHHMTATLKAWTNEVERASGGTLKINVMQHGLAKPPGQYDLAKNGIVDISWGVPAHTRGRFPLVRVMELPFLSPLAEVGSVSLWQWYEKHGLNESEFNDTRLLLVFVQGPGVLHTNKQVRTLGDLAGMKLRVGEWGVAMANALGAVPVPMSATKAHESLQKGTTTGTLFPWEAIKGYRLGKLVKYHLEFPGGLYTTPFFMTMNKRSWNNLSAGHKSVLNRVGGAWGSQFVGRFWDSADTVGKQVGRANRNIVSRIVPAEMDRWREKVRFMSEDWVAKANSAGHNGQALLDDLIVIIKKNSR